MCIRASLQLCGKGVSCCATLRGFLEMYNVFANRALFEGNVVDAAVWMVFSISLVMYS